MPGLISAKGKLVNNLRANIEVLLKKQKLFHAEMRRLRRRIASRVCAGCSMADKQKLVRINDQLGLINGEIMRLSGKVTRQNWEKTN